MTIRLTMAAITVVSSLLFLAIAITYAESVYSPHNVIYGSEGTAGWTVVFYGNDCFFSCWRKRMWTDLGGGLSFNDPDVGKPNPGELQFLGAYGPLTQWHFSGYGFDHVNIPMVEVATEIWAPTWLLLTITGAWPLYRLLRFRAQLRLRRQRRKLGLCPRCGYDIRATPNRCSECGFELTPNAASRQNPI